MRKSTESKISNNIEDIKKKEIQNTIKEGKYHQAEKFLQEYIEKFTKYDDVIAIFDAEIGEYSGDRRRVWESIRKGLMFNSRNYELYVMLGNYYLPENIYQSYLCYENALFYCDNPEDKVEIGQLLYQLEDQYRISVNKTAIVILSKNIYTIPSKS